MNIETVDGIYPHLQNLRSISFHTSGRRTQDSNIHLFQTGDIRNNRKTFQLIRYIRGISAYDSRYFKIRCDLKRIKHIASDISIADNGSSYLFHLFLTLNLTLQITK